MEGVEATNNAILVDTTTPRVIMPRVEDTELTSGLCVQASTNGRLTSAAAACGSGGGGVGGYFPVSLTTSTVGILPVASGGTGTGSPGLVVGTNITSITGTWPNQTINAATQSGGGGSSSLAVGTGTTTGWSGAPASSPTVVEIFDMSQLTVSLQGGATAFVAIRDGIATPTGNFTFGSTTTVALANCAASCTQTLPTAIGISGKTYSIKMQSVPPVQVTVATIGGQTIDGVSTQVLYLQNTTLEVISDGSNYQIR